MNEKGFNQWFIKQKDYYLEKYYFLGIKEETWHKLFTEALNKCEQDKNKATSFILNRINNYIKKEIANKKTRIFNNLLLVLKRTQKTDKDLLISFLKELKDLSITFDEDYFNLLKQNSKILSTILTRFSLLNTPLKDLNTELEDSLMYVKIKPSNVSMANTKKIFCYLLSLLPKSTQVQLLAILKSPYIITSSEFTKLKYLIQYYEEFISILNIFNKQIKELNQDLYMKTLLSASLEELKYYINEYYHFQGSVYDNTKLDFLYKLNTKIIEQIKKELPKSKPLPKPKTIFDYFTIILTPEEKQVVEDLFNNFPIIKKERIKKLLEGTISISSLNGKKALADLNYLENKIKKDREPKRKRKPKTCLEDYFKDEDGFISDPDKEVVKELFNCLSLERQEGILGFIEGIYHETDPIGKKASGDITTLQRRFKRYKEVGIISGIKKDIYDYFKDEKCFISEHDKEVVNILLYRLSSTQQADIKEYIAGSKDLVKRRQTAGLILNLQSQFKRYKKIGTLRRYADLYTYCNADETLNGADKLIIDYLFFKLAFDKQNKILSYIAGTYLDKDKKTRASLYQLKVKYNSLKAQLNNTSSYERLNILYDGVKKIEQTFYDLNFTKEEYQEYRQTKHQELNAQDIDLVKLYIKYVNESYIYIKHLEQKNQTLI